MIIFEKFSIKTPKREVLIDITEKIQNLVNKSEIKEGDCHIFIPHTTAGVTINENADPSVKEDITAYLSRLIPKNSGLDYTFKHFEGNSDAHIKSSLTGPSLELIIHEGQLVLGTWQGIMFAEYDGPRTRKIYLQFRGEN